MKRYIVGVIIGLMLGGLSYAGITACGGTQNYCVSASGIIHAMREQLGGPDVFDFAVLNVSVDNFHPAVGLGPTAINVNGTYTAECTPIPTYCEALLFTMGSTVTIPDDKDLDWVSGIMSVPKVNVGTNLLEELDGMFIIPQILTPGAGVTLVSGINIDMTNAAVADGAVESWGILMQGTDQAGGTVDDIKNNFVGHTIIGRQSTAVTNAPKPSLIFEPVTFANLPASVNGVMAWCSNCTETDPCAAAGTGSFAKRQNNRWKCN